MFSLGGPNIWESLTSPMLHEVRRWLLSMCFLCHAHWFARTVAKFNTIHVALRHLLNIHKGIGYKFCIACCCTLTSTPDFGKAPSQLLCSSFQGIQKTFRSVYRCIRTHKSQQESMWVAKILDHSSTWTHGYSYRSHSASPFPATGLF